MKRMILACAAVLFATASHSAARADEPSVVALEEQAFKQAVAFVEPSLVRIQTVGGLDKVGQVLIGTGPTTGVVVSKDGFIISSAFNFVSKPASVLVELPDGRRFPAQQVSTDLSRMITLLKIDANDLTPVVPVPKNEIQVGQWGIAVGRTFDAQTPSVSVGIVSATQRIWGKAIQTDAKVSPINYGGPLVDVQGRAMGVLVPLSTSQNEATAGVEWYDSGIGFAIPMEDVYAVLERMKAGKDLRPGLMGVSFRRDDLTEGEIVVDMVRPDSPAFRAGMRPKDILLKIDDKPLTRIGHLRYALGTKYDGDTVKVEFRHGEELIVKDVTLVGELIPYEAGFLGVLPTRDARTAEAAGIEIRYVYAESAAAQAGLQPHDIITKIQDRDVTTYESAWEILSQERPNEKVSITYLRGTASNTVEVELGEVTQEIPFDLTDSFIPPPENREETLKDIKTGLVNVDMEAHKHSYWAYVPQDYNPAYGYGLVVWLHPGGDTMEATIAEDWRTLCEMRGLILLAPKADKLAGWNLNEAEFVHDAVKDIQSKYQIDPARICLHSYADGGTFAYHLFFKHRDLFRGAAIVAEALRVAPPENSPEYRQQLLLICGTKDQSFQPVQATSDALQQMKYPVTLITVEGRDRKYSPEEEIRDIAIWIDTLDRL